MPRTILYINVRFAFRPLLHLIARRFGLIPLFTSSDKILNGRGSLPVLSSGYSSTPPAKWVDIGYCSFLHLDQIAFNYLDMPPKNSADTPKDAFETSEKTAYLCYLRKVAGVAIDGPLPNAPTTPDSLPPTCWLRLRSLHLSWIEAPIWYFNFADQVSKTALPLHHVIYENASGNEHRYSSLVVFEPPRGVRCSVAFVGQNIHHIRLINGKPCRFSPPVEIEHELERAVESIFEWKRPTFCEILYVFSGTCYVIAGRVGLSELHFLHQTYREMVDGEFSKIIAEQGS